MSPRDERSLSEIRALLAGASGAKLRQLASELASDDRVGVAQAVAAAQARELVHAAERTRITALYSVQARLAHEGALVVAGVDEVGRGALAGPLSAGACVLPLSPRIEGLDDSKRLSPARRSEIAESVRASAICWHVAHVDAWEIDTIGVSAALRRAMGRALAGLELEPDHVLVDGLPVGVAPVETAVVKGDAKIAAIAAASVLAKVERDALMVELASEHAAYGFEVNKGYGTAEHIEAIRRHGMCPQHRRSFSPGGGTEPLF
jgi:ribonuclease HII